MAPRSLAIAIGIEYDSHGGMGMLHLRGCYRDLANFCNWLRRAASLSSDDLCVLGGASLRRPTHAGIRHALAWATAEAQEDPAVSTIWVYYSGHGNVLDVSVRGMVPCDYKTSGIVTQSELGSWLRSLPGRVCVHYIADACGAPNQLGIPPTKVYGMVTSLSRRKRRRSSAEAAPVDKGPSSSRPLKRQRPERERERERAPEESRSTDPLLTSIRDYPPQCTVIAISSCAPSERSMIYANLPDAPGYVSLFTWAFLKAVQTQRLVNDRLPLHEVLRTTQDYVSTHTSLQHVTLGTLGAPGIHSTVVSVYTLL